MQKKSPHTLYFVGGLSRVGKSIIAKKVARGKRLMIFSTDTIRSMIRNVLLGKGHVSVQKISFRGTATFRRPGDLTIRKVAFAKNNLGEDELTWLGMLGLIRKYDRKDASDFLIEGIAVTPERVRRLKLKNISIRAVFIGYDDESHAASILAYSKRKKDWVDAWIREHGGNDAHVKNRMVKKGIARSATIKKLAKKFGYGYFDVASRPFKKHVQAVTDYLLKD